MYWESLVIVTVTASVSSLRPANLIPGTSCNHLQQAIAFPCETPPDQLSDVVIPNEVKAIRRQVKAI
jgi:hypothetical protein